MEQPQNPLDLGFRLVGKDFPVFLHPKSHAEVALARTERKIKKGHTGFVVHADPSVTLETDLRRRDFTINAMALSRDGLLSDPYGGKMISMKGCFATSPQHFQKIPSAFCAVFVFGTAERLQIQNLSGDC